MAQTEASGMVGSDEVWVRNRRKTKPHKIIARPQPVQSSDSVQGMALDYNEHCHKELAYDTEMLTVYEKKWKTNRTLRTVENSESECTKDSVNNMSGTLGVEIKIEAESDKQDADTCSDFDSDDVKGMNVAQNCGQFNFKNTCLKSNVNASCVKVKRDQASIKPSFSYKGFNGEEFLGIKNKREKVKTSLSALKNTKSAKRHKKLRDNLQSLKKYKKDEMSREQKGEEFPKTDTSIEPDNEILVTSSPSDEGDEGDSSKPYICPVCDCRFKMAFPLKRHMLIHSAVKPFACTICEFRCNDGSNLRKHMLTHSEKKKFSCDQCSYTCTRSDHLKKHKLKHSGHYPFHCGLCGNTYLNCADLTRHMMTHSGQRLFSCPNCEFGTNRRTTLNNHITAKHTDDKPYMCGLCNYAPATSAALRRHMRIHTGVKPYQCTRCEYKCADKSSFLRHMNALHPDARIYCEHCSYGTFRTEDLETHMMERHPHASVIDAT